MRPIVTLIALLMIAGPLAGCITAPAAEGSQPSSPTPTTVASPTPKAREPQTTTVEGSVGGSKSETKKLEVPVGATRLTVDASWAVGGTAYFKLVRPGGAIAKDDSVSGGSSRASSEWFSLDDPTPGTWEFSLSVSGGANYRFDITY